jgi:hypothetical protein
MNMSKITQHSESLIDSLPQVPTPKAAAAMPYHTATTPEGSTPSSLPPPLTLAANLRGNEL